MAGMAEKAGQSAKRKRSSSDKRPSKRVRSESIEEDGQAQILLLENEISESKKNYNNIAKLIEILKSTDGNSEDSILAAIALCRVFTRLIVSGEMTKRKAATEKETVVTNWLRERYSEYKKELLEGLLPEEEVTSTALALCMRLLKSEGQHLQQTGLEPKFPTAFLRDMVQVFLTAEGAANARKEFGLKYVEEYDDIQYYMFEAVEKVLVDGASQCGQLFDAALELLTAAGDVPEDEDEFIDFYVIQPQRSTHVLKSLEQRKKRCQTTWLALLNLGMDKDQRKSILKIMGKTIAPWFTKPELLMDFLTDSYNEGGSTSLLALSGVFYLISERNLDYPSFYKKLYSLLDSGLLHSKHRSRFFRLLDTFLASTHLPALLVASFIKRLSRLTLSSPPSGVIAVVPWIYNLLKTHPTCMFMIHRETRFFLGDKASLEKEGLDDPFLMEEGDPMETHAIESSLWEMVMLQSHYHPNVATLAKIISEQFTKVSYNMEDFLDHSYGSMLEAEHMKDVKKLPVIEFEIPKKIFMKQVSGSGVEDSLVAKLWSFS